MWNDFEIDWNWWGNSRMYRNQMYGLWWNFVFLKYGEIICKSMVNYVFAFEDITMNLELLESSSGWLKEFTWSFLQKISSVNNFFPLFANHPGLANILDVEQFEYFLYHFWWQMAKAYRQFYPLCISHFESYPSRKMYSAYWAN